MAVAVIAGAVALDVVDPDEMDWQGGSLQIGAEVLGYSMASDGTVELSGPTANAYDEGEPVLLAPAVPERLAYLQAPDQDEALEARVPHALWDRIALGIRDADAFEGETVEADFEDEQLVIRELVGKTPEVDLSYGLPGSLPPASDGEPPAASPAATVQSAIGALAVTWDQVANADPTTYEIHLSTVTGFAPDASTLVAEVYAGTVAFLTREPDGDPLAYGTTYYVKLIAKDPDGAAAAGAQGSGQIAQVTAPDLADLAVTLGKIADNAVTNAAIADNAVTAGEIAAGAVGETEIAALAVTEAKVAALAISSGKIANAAVGSTQLGTDAVGAAHIQALAVGSAELAALAVTTAKIAADAVTAGEIAADAVGSSEIAALAVTSAELGALAVTTAKIAADAVTAAEIAASAVGNTELAAGAVTAAKITALTITGAEIAAGAITAAKITALTITAAEIAAATITGAKIAADTLTATEIAASAITSSELAAGAVIAGKITAGTIVAADIAAATITAANIAGSTITAAQIAADTITAGQIAADAITSSEIAALTIVAGDIAAGAITTAKILAGNVTTNEIAATTILAANIAAATITGAKIAAGTITASNITAATITATELAALSVATGNLQANAVTAAKIAAGTITAVEIASATITGDRLVANTITAAKIAAATITANELATGSVTAAKISVSSLSAISADMGLVTAGTIRGGIFETSASNPKVRFDATDAFFVTDSTGAKVVNLAAGGLSLLASSLSSPPTERRVTWLHPTTGLRASDLASDYFITDAGRLSMSAWSPNASHTDKFAKFEGTATPTSQYGRLLVGDIDTSYKTFLIGSSDGDSSFVQHTNPGTPSHSDRGAVAVAMGNTSLGTTSNVGHSLGVVPTIVVATADNSALAGSSRCHATVGGLSSVDFDVSVRVDNGSNINGSVLVYWWAIS